jgi:hypothetical protein
MAPTAERGHHAAAATGVDPAHSSPGHQSQLNLVNFPFAISPVAF